MQYRSDIEGLRAIAVLSVVTHHLDHHLLPGGYLGVDVFFVISGYVITGSAVRRDWNRFWPAFVDFFSRRFKRLAPALLLCLTITSVVISFFVIDPGSFLQTGQWAAVGLSNIQLYREATDYFGVLAATNPFTHTWSLGVEEQFYLIFPAMAWMCLSARVPRRLTQILPVLICAALLASALAFLMLFASRHDAAFYLLPFRAWQLGLGALVFLARDWLVQWPAPLSYGFLAVLAGALLFPGASAHAWPSLAAALATAGLLHMGKSRPLHWLSVPPLLYFGRTSYSLYLWHWPVVVLAKWTVGVTLTTAPFLVGLMVLLAHLSYACVERPLRYRPWSSSGLTSGLCGFAVLFSVLALITILRENLGGRLYRGEPIAGVTGIESLVWPVKDRVTGITWTAEDCVLTGARDIGNAIDIANCTFGDADGARSRILVVGDSFAASFKQAMEELSAQTGWAVTLTSSWGATPLPGIGSEGIFADSTADYWSRVVPRLVSRLSPGDIVLSVADLHSFSDISPLSHSERQGAYREAAIAYSESLSRRDLHLAVVAPLPFIREADCPIELVGPQWFTRGAGMCTFHSRQETLTRQASLRDTLDSLTAEGVLGVVDLFDAFCPGPVCGFVDDAGAALYRDIHAHPSISAALATVPIFERHLGAIRH